MGDIGVGSVLSPAQQTTSRKVDRLLSIHDLPQEHTFLPASLAMATLPYVDPGPAVLEWRRRAFDFELYIRAHSDYGLPFGVYPRLLMMWLTNEIKRSGKRVIKLGRSYYAFLLALKIQPKGKARILFTNQANRLLLSAIMYERRSEKRRDHVSAEIATRYSTWWNVNFPETPDAEITVGEVFFEHVMKHAFPLDIRIIDAIRRSPLALDLYAWLTFRYYTLKSETRVPWPSLQKQFGTETDASRLFKARCCKYLELIKCAYRGARFKTTPDHLILYPSPTSVPPTSFRHQISVY